MDNTIILKKADGCWHAEFIGPHAEHVRRVFNLPAGAVCIIPTAFTDHADSFDVRNAIAKRNPGVTVKVELASR